MPLAFQSLSHGKITFGFYNIETDFLLLENLFFFSTDFCQAAVALKKGNSDFPIPGHRITPAQEVGDLMGAIHDIRHVGYLGAIYQIWPFPQAQEDFRQKLDGSSRQKDTLAILEKYGEDQVIEFSRSENSEIFIGDYRFTLEQFEELVAYVWRGGYPTWQEFEKERWPGYLDEMVQLYGLV